MLNVFRREGSKVRHFWDSEMTEAPSERELLSGREKNPRDSAIDPWGPGTCRGTGFSTDLMGAPAPSSYGPSRSRPHL